MKMNNIKIKPIGIIHTPYKEPYSKHFDCREEAVSGWLDKHFINGNIPKRTIV